MKKRTLGLIVIAILLVFNISERGYADLNDGLVAYYPFNGNANDESGNGNNGIVYGATLAVDRYGKPNGAYYFDGSSNYIKVPHKEILNIQNSLSIVSWVYVESYTYEFASIVCKGDTASMLNSPYALTVRTYTELILDRIELIGNVVVPLKTWVHIAATWDGTNVGCLKTAKTLNYFYSGFGIHFDPTQLNTMCFEIRD